MRMVFSWFFDDEVTQSDYNEATTEMVRKE